jgi:O-antigen/teichoic acid export membrane protein
MGKSVIFRKVSFGFIAAAVSIGIDGLAGLIILPMLLKFLSKEIAGLWLFFVSFSGLILLGQAGLAPVVIRLTAEIKSKSKSILGNNFWGTAFWGYNLATLFVFIICLVLYFSYVRGILIEQNFIFQGTLCWFFLSLSYMIRIFCIKYLHFVNGFGEVGWDKIIQIFVALLNLGGFYVVLKMGFNFSALGIVYLISGILFAILSYYVFKRFNKSYIQINKITTTKKNVFLLFSESGKILILNLTAFAVLQSNMFIIERIIGLEILPYYAGLYRITTLILAVSGIVSAMLFPFISQSFAKNELSKVKDIFKKNVIISNGIAIVISLVVFVAAPYLVPIWLGPNSYLGNDIFGLMLLLVIIYTNHTAFANSIIAIGANTFVYPAILNAILSISFAILGGLKFGIIGIILGNIIGTIIPSVYVTTWSLKYIKNLK